MISPSWSSPGRRWGRSSPCWDWRSPPPCPGCWALLSYCTDYLRILLLFAPASILQLLFQSFFVTAGRPGLGLGLTVCSGLTNAVLDYAFIVPLDMGITGAALATAAGYWRG